MTKRRVAQVTSRQAIISDSSVGCQVEDEKISDALEVGEAAAYTRRILLQRTQAKSRLAGIDDTNLVALHQHAQARRQERYSAL